MSGPIDTIKAALGFEPGLATFTAKLTGFATRHAELGRERDGLLTALPTRADAAATVPRLVAERRATLLSLHGGDLVSALSGGLTWGSGPAVERVPPHVPDVLAGFSAFELRALLEPDRLVADLVALFPATGSTIEQRLVRIQAVDAEREVIEREHAKAVDRAGELGLTLPHLPVTAAKRQAARNQAERDAHEARDAELTARRRRS